MTNWNLEEVYKTKRNGIRIFKLSMSCKNIVSFEGKLNNLEAIEEYLAYEEKYLSLLVSFIVIHI